MSPDPNRLLIVDDDPELLRFLMEELGGAGHHCIGCDNGQDALLRWRQESFDLVVLEGDRIALNEVYVHEVTKIPG